MKDEVKIPNHKEQHQIVMEAPAPDSKESGPKAPIYTHGKYWGGTVLPYWAFLVFTANPLTGFFGIDHLLFRSAPTAFLKFIVNIFGLGIWYFYDIIQAFYDRDSVSKYGLSKPIMGPGGLAKDYFRGVTSEPDKLGPSKTGLLGVVIFVLYICSFLIPFGTSNFIAGDMTGGFWKLVFTFSFPFNLIWIPVIFIGGIFEFFRAVFSPDSLFQEGTLRIPPISFLAGKNGLAPRIMPPDVYEKKEEEGTFMHSITSFFNSVFSFIPGLSEAVEPPVKAAVKTAQVAQQEVVKAKNAAVQASQGVAAIAATGPAVAAKVSEKLNAFSDPAKIAELAAAQQKGGGIQTGNETLDYLIIGGVLLLAIGGIAISFARKSGNFKKNDEPSTLRRETTHDAPPQPGTL